MNQWQNIQNSFKNWRREQVLWVLVVILGVLILAGWYVLSLRRPNTPAQTQAAADASLTPSATASPSELPTLEELPYEQTQSDIDLTPAFTEEGEGGFVDEPPDETQMAVTESPTWYVRPFTSRTPTRPPSSGGGGGFVFPTATPNNYWTAIARTGTAAAKTATASATYLVPTRQTATVAARLTSTNIAYLTSIARTPRPPQLAFSGNSGILNAPLSLVITSTVLATTPTPTPAAVFVVVPPPPDRVMGDWAPEGRRIVYSQNGRLNIVAIDISGSLNASTPVVPLDRQPEGTNDQANWSPNGRWIVFRNTDADGNTFLYRMNPDGTRIQRLTNGTAAGQVNVAFPDWSPDSGTIVYVSNGDLYTIAVNPVAAVPQYQDQVAVYRRENASVLARFWNWLFPPAKPLAQTEPEQTQTAEAETATAVFNQTGTAAAETAIAQTQAAGTATAVAETQAAQTQAAGTATAVAQTQAAQTQAAGTATAVSQTATASAPTPTAIATLVVTTPVRLTNTGEQEAWPHFASDGKSILYGRFDGSQWDVYLLTPGRTPPVQQLTSTGENEGWPFWSPDARFLFGFIRGSVDGSRRISGQIYLVDRYGLETEWVGSTSDMFQPMWRP